MQAQSGNNPEAQIQSAWPSPPMEYVNYYTDEAIKRGTAPKPPPTPGKERYEVFGQVCREDDVIIQPLETQGIPRLHPENYDKQEELKKILVSILCNFFDLLEILAECAMSPDRDAKIEDLNILFIHMHHIINEFRPHQARETLKVIMDFQKKHMADASEVLILNMEKATEILRCCSEEVALIHSQKQNLPCLDTKETINEPMVLDIDNLLSDNLSHVNGIDGSISESQIKQEVVEEVKDDILCEMLDVSNE